VGLLINSFHDALPEKGIHYLGAIADSARQMAALIDDLLQFSRTGRQEMLQAHIDMNLVLQEVLESIKQDNTGRNIEWIIATLPNVYGDYAMLRLVWINLLNNAVKFTRKKEKAKIEVGCREDNMEYVFFVRDNGVGFDMQYAHKLFGVFQRLHSSEEFEGTGIGLANVRRIIAKHGGHTWAEAALDQGAVFYFTLLQR
jgi:light-regulated signal transduction histidine kinase (bacteriophytochrome)